jgi:hypothetical protein
MIDEYERQNRAIAISNEIDDKYSADEDDDE